MTTVINTENDDLRRVHDTLDFATGQFREFDALGTMIKLLEGMNRRGAVLSEDAVRKLLCVPDAVDMDDFAEEVFTLTDEEYGLCGLDGRWFVEHYIPKSELRHLRSVRGCNKV